MSTLPERAWVINVYGQRFLYDPRKMFLWLLPRYWFSTMAVFAMPGPVQKKFEGGITVKHVTNAEGDIDKCKPSMNETRHHHNRRAFNFDVTFHLDNQHLIRLASQKPPLHFHPYQEEYIQVTSGVLGVEVHGKEFLLAPEDGELAIQRWTHHRLYPVLSTTVAANSGNRVRIGEAHHDDVLQAQEDRNVTRFLLSGEDSASAFRLDTVFFQNWYAYQEMVVTGGQEMDLIQVMNMFDAGGSYLSFPSWIPFNTRLAQWVGIIVGRWIGGGLLGYQPFHREWTSDWQTACDKMRTNIFLRRFADPRRLNEGVVSE